MQKMLDFSSTVLYEPSLTKELLWTNSLKSKESSSSLFITPSKAANKDTQIHTQNTTGAKILKQTQLEMWANAQCDGRLLNVDGALCSTPQFG